MKRFLALLIALCFLAGCVRVLTPTPTPDLVATQVVVMEAAAATLTVRAPAATATATAAPSPLPTALPSSTPTTARLSPTIGPTSLPKAPPLPTPTQPPPTLGPSLGQFAVVGVYSDDVLNVRAGPGVDRPIVGTIPYAGRDVEVYAGEQQVGEARWVPVRYGQVSGWTNGGYLVRQVGQVSDAIAAAAAQAILALRDDDLQQLAGLVHPVKGVTFSPYAYVRPLQGAPGEADLVFSPAQLVSLQNDPTVYHWGVLDGSGEPIDLTFRQYYDRFVYDVDFAQPDVIGFNQTIGQGNSLNNIPAVYPNAVTVEYHFTGFDPQYGGMDWRSLRLVLEEMDGVWYVVGIVHDQWTI